MRLKKRLLFLLLLISPKIFACQTYLDEYNSDKKKARELSQATPVVTGCFSFLGPVVAFVASGITAVSSSLYDDRAEANLRKYNRCLEEKNEEELQLRKKKARLEVESEINKSMGNVEDN